VEVLRRPDHVDHPVELIGPVAVEQCGQIAGGIERGAVRLAQEAGGKLILRQVDKSDVLVLAGHAGLERRAHGVVEHLLIEALARPGVEVDAEEVIHAAEVRQRRIAEHLPQGSRLRVPLLDALVPCARLILEGGVGLRLLVEAHVQPVLILDRGGRQVQAAPPVLHGRDELAELGSPVAHVVHSHYAVAQEAEQLVQRVADDGRP